MVGRSILSAKDTVVLTKQVYLALTKALLSPDSGQSNITVVFRFSQVGIRSRGFSTSTLNKSRQQRFLNRCAGRTSEHVRAEYLETHHQLPKLVLCLFSSLDTYLFIDTLLTSTSVTGGHKMPGVRYIPLLPGPERTEELHPKGYRLCLYQTLRAHVRPRTEIPLPWNFAGPGLPTRPQDTGQSTVSKSYYLSSNQCLWNSNWSEVYKHIFFSKYLLMFALSLTQV